MSEGAYKECEICGNRVHMNHTCKQWGGKNNCQGDPWGIKVRLQSEIDMLDQTILNMEADLTNKRALLQAKRKKLNKI